MWDYSSSNTQSIQKVVWDFDWEKTFGSLSVDRKADPLNGTLLNIFRNCIPNKRIKLTHCEPPWMNDNIKRCLKE